MIYYFFGDNFEALYSKRIEFINRGFLVFNPIKGSLNSELLSLGFFETNKKLIVDFLNECSDLSDVNYAFIKKIAKKSEIVFISSKEDKGLIEIADNHISLNFSKNNDIFLLIDAVYSGNIALSIKLYERFKNKDLENYVFSMLFFPIKNILYYLFDEKSFKKLHPFVSKKTLELKSKIGNDSIIMNILHFLSQADNKIKTGSNIKNIFISYIIYLKLLLKNVQTAHQKEA